MDPDPDPDPRKEFEVDPDPALDPERGSKWIRIRIRPNVVDPGGSGSGSGSETLIKSQPSVRDIGRIKAHTKQSSLIWKGYKLQLEI